MAERFTQEGWRRVREQVGEGLLVGKLLIDQIYAKYQHERLDLYHPRGGGPKYLERPLFANHSDYLARIAKAILHGDPEQAMIDSMESLNRAMAAAAPVDLNNLRRSGSPRVYSNGRKVYHRPANQHRLSRNELRELGRYRRRGGRGRR